MLKSTPCSGLSRRRHALPDRTVDSSGSVRNPVLLWRFIAVSDYRRNDPQANVCYHCGITACCRWGCLGVMFQHTGDSYLLVDVLREILVRVDGVGAILSHERVTMTVLYQATGDALCGSTA